MDNNLLKKINGLIEKSFMYLSQLQTQYGFTNIELSIYPWTYTNDDIKCQINSNGPSAMMFTLITIDEVNVYDDGNKDIKKMVGHIYMPYEQLYQLLIECDLDYDKTFECMKFTIRHEVGHIIAANNKYVGKHPDEWNKHCNDGFDYSNFPKVRKNATFENRCKWFVKYNFEIPAEKEANEAVGITPEEIIENCKRMCGRL